MREGRVIRLNEDVDSHSSGVSCNDSNIAVIGDQCLVSYPLSGIILVKTVPRYPLCAAPCEILLPCGMRGWFDPGAHAPDEAANASGVDFRPNQRTQGIPGNRCHE